MSGEVEHRLRSLEHEVADRNGAVGALERRVDELEQALKAESARVNSLSELVARLAATVGRVVGVLERDRGVHHAEGEEAQ